MQSLAANENRTFTYVEQVGGPGRWGRGEAGNGGIIEMLLVFFLEKHLDNGQIKFEGTYLGQTGSSGIFLFKCQQKGKFQNPASKHHQSRIPAAFW